MTDHETYEDPALVRRFDSWIDETAPPAAPERIVFNVMDEVERSGARGPFSAVRRIRFLGGLVQYAALTAVIAIGVAVGILVTRPAPNVGPASSPTPPPASPGAAASTALVPSLAVGPRYQLDATAITGDGSSLWVATNDGKLIELDAAGGAQRERADIGFPATQLVVDARFAWLAAPDHDLVRVELATGTQAATKASFATRLAAGDGAIWLGTDGRVQRVDAASPAVVAASYQVAGHRAEDPLLVVGSELWVGTNASIQRLDAATGTVVGSIKGDASALTLEGAYVWAARGIEILQIDPSTGATSFLRGDWPALAMVSGPGRVWLVGPPGDPRGGLIEIGASDRRLLSRTRIEAPLVGIAVAAGDAWVAAQGGPIWRYSATP